jgi:hypothetical protein
MPEENSASTEIVLPDNVGMHEAVELMGKMGLGDDTVAPNAQPEGNAVAPEAAPAADVVEDGAEQAAKSPKVRAKALQRQRLAKAKTRR